MSHFLKSGATFRVFRDDALDVRSELPAACYTIKQDPMSGEMFFETVDSFTLPDKLYGDCLSNTDRILATFKDRATSTGVLLSGEKGSGKTLLAKNLSMRAQAEGMPTILVNHPWRGEQFNQLIQAVQQPAVILFDEFEKVYDDDEQNEILTLLDGVFQTKKLFILTCNDRYRVNRYMTNRPGRLYYYLIFKGLDVGFIREYCEDALINKDHIDSVCNVSMAFTDFNFDMLKALVEEMNRFDEAPYEAMRLLNTRPEGNGASRFIPTMTIMGKPVDAEEFADTGDENEFYVNPMQPFSFDVYTDAISEDRKELASAVADAIKDGFMTPDEGKAIKNFDEDDHVLRIRYTPDDIVQMNAESGEFVFYNKDHTARLTLKRKPESDYSWAHLI